MRELVDDRLEADAGLVAFFLGSDLEAVHDVGSRQPRQNAGLFGGDRRLDLHIRAPIEVGLDAGLVAARQVYRVLEDTGLRERAEPIDKLLSIVVAAFFATVE